VGLLIKASDITLDSLLNLRHNEGENFLKRHRMIISSTEAWGMLGRDLIDALGIERAKRFLLRYGWHCGKHEANMFKDLFQWENDLEWLLAGQYMHNISGRVESVPSKLDIDMDKGLFDVEGHWYNSYEAKQYLMHFPPHNEPVCYFLIGYGGGYCSAILNKKVIFKEVECVGKGDHHCRYVGKTLEEWGSEIAEDLINYEQNDLADELDRAYKRIEKQSEIQTKVSLISQELTKIILQGKGFDAIVKTLGDRLHCYVFLENQNYNVISKYGNTMDISLQKLLAHEDSLRDNTNHTKLKKMMQERCTIELEVNELWGLQHNRLVTPIVLHNQIFGYISLIKFGEKFGELESVLLERSANICAIQMLNEQTAIETEQRMKGELLEELLSKPLNESFDSDRYAYLGYNLNQPHYVFVFQIEEKVEQQNPANHGAISDSIKKIKTFITSQIEMAGFHILISSRLDRIFALIPEGFLMKNKQNIKEYGEILLSNLESKTKTNKIILGISNLCTDIFKIHLAFKEANKAIEISKIKKNSSLVSLASELGYLALLLDARRPEELEEFAKKVLGPLYEYDLQNSTEFMKTIYCYLENECNLYKTSRSLHVSISGMRYRLNRIQKIVNIDLSNSTVRFDIQVSLEIYLAIGKLKI
jgi:purine catabolism regulator